MIDVAMEKRRPAWAEVDLDVVGYDMRQIRSIIDPNTLVTVAVKADGYGHGAIMMAKEFLANGADRLAVAVLDEAVELRQAGITAKILILGPTSGDRAEELITYGVDACVFHYEDALAFSQEAVKQHRQVCVHIGVDSGMGRIGYRPSAEAIKEVKAINELPNVVIEGIFTHFCIADQKDKTFTHQQYRTFMAFCDQLEQEGVHIPIRHCANSAAIVDLPEYHCGMVRAGIMIYGVAPSAEVDITRLHLKQAMTFKCKVTHVKTIESGDSVSYGRHFIAKGPTKIASLPIGYADGYSRSLTNKADVLVHGQRVPQVGNICMDQCMIDVTSVPDVKVGDEVVLFGYQGDTLLPVEEIADKIGTITNEVFCMVGRRVPRVYVRGGKEVARVEYLQQH